MALWVRGWLGKTDRVPVRVTDDEGVATPWFLLELLIKSRARFDVFGVKRFYILYFYESVDEGALILSANREDRLMHELQVKTGSVA